MLLAIARRSHRIQCEVPWLRWSMLQEARFQEIGPIALRRTKEIFSYMEPASIAIPAAVNGMKVLISAYEGYEQTRVRRTDRAVREDVRRRIHQVHRQVERWMIRAYTNGEKYGMSRIQSILHNLTSFAEDAQFAIAGETRPKHDGIRRMTRKIHKKLIEHDRETIAMLEHASQHLNATMAAYVETRNIDLDIIDGVLDKARRHFAERNRLLDDLRN